jgi:formylglycine-generating enzyme required for sulfatase activity
MKWVPGGSFMMGSNHHYPEEAPVHISSVGGFWMDQYLVTNAQFRAFVENTGYTTFAERPPRAEDYPGAPPEMLTPGSVVFVKPPGPVDLSDYFQWWTWIAGADWRHPHGPQTSNEGLDDYPVVHVAFEDVQAYALWVKKDIPSEAEWEFAARGGLEGEEYTWGSEFAPEGKQMANTWQGAFPHENLLTDGYEGASPVGAFPPNGYGIFDLIGNVWEWTSDWYEPHHQRLQAKSDRATISEQAQSCCGQAATDRAMARSYDPSQPGVQIPRRVMKGGSHLCAPNYCRRYRPAARMAQPIDTSTVHLGFRLIVRPKE